MEIKLHTSKSGWVVMGNNIMTSFYKEGVHCPERQSAFITYRTSCSVIKTDSESTYYSSRYSLSRICVSRCTGMTELFESFITMEGINT